MFDIEIFLQKKLNPLYRGWYTVFLYWWPLWKRLHDRRTILERWDQFGLVKRGQSFLDYGCGPGVFSIPAARIVGPRGKVYALDCIPRHLRILEKRAKEEGLTNVETILSDRETGLPDECIDVVWMCAVLHEIEQKEAILEEMHRVLRRNGILGIYDGMKDGVLSYTAGLFALVERGGKFLKLTKP